MDEAKQGIMIESDKASKKNCFIQGNLTMIKCPFCGKNNVINTVFCNNCGNYLLEDDQRKTDPLDKVEFDQLKESVGLVDNNGFTPELSGSMALRLKIGSRKREVEVRLDSDVKFGRVDPTTTVFPEIDLTSDEGPMKSVSRQHARIFKQEDDVKLEDLGSVNGTFINGKRLDPYMPEPLCNGDQVQLGNIPVDVMIQHR